MKILDPLNSGILTKSGIVLYRSLFANSGNLVITTEALIVDSGSSYICQEPNSSPTLNVCSNPQQGDPQNLNLYVIKKLILPSFKRYKLKPLFTNPDLIYATKNQKPIFFSPFSQNLNLLVPKRTTYLAKYGIQPSY